MAAGLAGIREALARLALEGLVLRRARVGTIGGAAGPGGGARGLRGPRPDRSRMRAVWPPSARTEAEIAAIRATLEDGEDAVAANDAGALAAMDEAFHVAVATASHNRALAKMVTTLHHQTARFWLNAMRGPSPTESMPRLERTSRPGRRHRQPQCGPRARR